jgi:predicted nuclease of predicted toxin-antitoxin system
MRILIDQNISFRLISRIEKVFPDAFHVKSVSLLNTNDLKIFMYARRNNFDAILTIDEDFINILLAHSVPPKIIWLRLHNASIDHQAEIILKNALTIHRFIENPDADCLEVFA